jgi:predicted permease
MQLKGGGAPFRVTLGWSVLRLLALPLIAAAIAISLGVSPTMLTVILIATAVPTASNGAILARKLGGDAQLAANLIALQTVLAVLTVTGIFWAAEVLDLI